MEAGLVAEAAGVHGATADRHERTLLLILGGIGMTYSLMQTMAIPAIPALAQDLHTTTSWATWVATSFLLVSAVVTPICGKLGDQFGRARVLVAVVGLFFAATVGAACAWSIASLIAFRAVQGVSGALFPLAFAIIRDEFRPERVRRGIGFLSSVLGIASALGFLLAGLILDHLSWRFIFVFPAAFALLALWLAHRFVPRRTPRARTAVDVPGSLLLAATLVSLLLALTEGSERGFSTRIVLVLFAGTVLAGFAWVRAEIRSAAPLIDIRLLAGRTLAMTSVIAVISSMANFGTFVLVPALAETPRHVPPAERDLVHYGLGASATRAGLLLLPLALAMMISAPLAARLGHAIGVKRTFTLGLGSLSLLMWALALWHSSTFDFVWQMALQGVCFGFIYTSLMTIAVHGGPASDTGVLTGLVTTFRTMGAQLGAQSGAAILAAMTIAGTSVPSESAFEVAFTAAGFVTLVSTVLAAFITPIRRIRAT